MIKMRIVNEENSIRFQDHLQDLVNDGWVIRKVIINDLIDSFHNTYYHAVLSKDMAQPQQTFEWEE